MAESQSNVMPRWSQGAESSEQHDSITTPDPSSSQEIKDEVHTNKAVTNELRVHAPTQIPGPTMSSIASVQRLASTDKAATADGDGFSEQGKDRPQRYDRSSPAWPTSPRLKSPPPSNLRSASLKRNDNDHTQSNVSVKRLALTSTPEFGAATPVSADTFQEIPSPSKARSPARGPSTPSAGLETVVEGSRPSTPPTESIPRASVHQRLESTDRDEKAQNTILNGITSTLEVPTKTNEENGSSSAPTSRAASTSRPPVTTDLAKRSLTNLTGKKAAVEPMRSMTVETETVNSTPQLLVDRARDPGGSVRAKPSVETIRPRKDKKKASRKTPSLHAGTGTSKADIFEAKVASAVEEADSSDSDETFVYESNPPEPRQSRHHSRTPSATSTTSQMDHLGRGKHGVRSGSAAIQGKKSMKFSNNVYGTHLDPDTGVPDVNRNGTRNGSSAHRHHHIGRHGRNTGHASIMDADSPFSQAHRTASPRTPTANGNRHLTPISPRLSNGRLNGGRKMAAGGYDTYDDGADDERAPLISSVRVTRNRHNRRPNGHFRNLELSEQREKRWWPRYGGCLLLTMLIALVAIGISTFVLALNRPLLDVEVKSIHHVLAAEQELMLDLQVRAINPNLFTIAVNDLDINLFAESPYAGTSQQWRGKQPARRQTITERRQHQQDPSQPDASSWFPPFGPADGVDEGNDPIDDPEPGTQKLLLGQILAFDSPLTFDPSPFRRSAASSDGEIRLKNPGNGTKDAGSERWERVMQHPFDLIVRGVLKYQLPLSSHNRSAKISGRVKVLPGQDEDDGTNSTTII